MELGMHVQMLVWVGGSMNVGCERCWVVENVRSGLCRDMVEDWVV